MAEPSSTTLAVAGLLGAGFAGFLAGVNAEAAVGSLCGALIFFVAAKEHPVAWRMVLFMVSFVMGYLFAPLLSATKLNAWGVEFGPLNLPGPAAFIASAFVVTVTLVALKSRGRAQPAGG